MYATSAYTSSGAMQFYPNPYTDYVTNGTTIGGLGVINQATYPATTFVNVGSTQNTWLNLTNYNTDISNASWGGMCVRAVGGSKVKARNVMFPTGWADASGAYYDASTAGGCDLLRIWNLSVSSLHPQDTSAVYTGPSAVWVSGSSPNYIPLSGAPENTPNTGMLSVLDSFGLGYEHGGALGFYGKSTFENIGPFRIYVSPNAKAKFLGYPYAPTLGAYTPYGPGGTGAFFSMGYNMPNTSTLSLSGVPYQLIAQGYATSSDCSAINNQGANYTNASAIYQDLGFSAYMDTHPQLNTPGGTGPTRHDSASSFYYTSAMLGDSQNRIWLDESAMNTFANAKNGTLGTSGRKKIFSYYKTTTDYPGEGSGGDGNYPHGIRSANLFDLDREL